jgi:hypothetical protein
VYVRFFVLDPVLIRIVDKQNITSASKRMLFGAPRMPINPSEATDPTAAPDKSTAYIGKLNAE